MRKLLVMTVVLSLTMACAKDVVAQPKENTPVDYVNILMGTLSEFLLSNGNTYPAIAMPWGMNFWTPQTRKNGDGWQYVYIDHKIQGFKQTHQPSPWMNDYGQFSIFPMTDKMEFDQEKRASWYSHKAEVAKPYYYSVYLADYDVTTEITPTERAAIFRFTFPETENSYVLVDAFEKGSLVEILPEKNAIVGYTTRNSGGVPENFKNYFVVQFDKPFQYKNVVKDGKIQEQVNKMEADHAGAFIGFPTRKGERVVAKVASSFISYEQAWQNLKEVSGKDFETVKQEGRDVWNEVLGKIEVEGGDLDQKRTFYSTFYRSTLFPRKFHEIDAEGNIIHYSPYNGQVLPGYMYTDTGFWDTFRALFPFLNLVYPSVNVEIQEGLVNAYKESGFLPEWASPGHRGVMDKLYTPYPDGYCGDEDNGQTSAWYVFSALGFYPVCPGSDQYILGSPLFQSVEIDLENGKTLKIQSTDNGKGNRYIEEMKLNGMQYTKNYLNHDDLMKGGEITFKMSALPNKERGAQQKDFPYSFSNEQ